MIVNKNAAGHNCNACHILFVKVQYPKYHMEEKKCPTSVASQEGNFGKYKIKKFNNFHGRRDQKYFVKCERNIYIFCHGAPQRYVP